MTVTLDTLAAARANAGLHEILCRFDVYLEKPEERHHHIYLIDRYARIDLIASDPAGGHFLLCHPEGHVIHASSEGQASVIAVDLTDCIDLIVSYPYWRSILTHDLPAMRAAVAEAEATALEDQPKLGARRDALRAEFGLRSETADPLEALQRAIALNVGLIVRVTTDPDFAYEVTPLNPGPAEQALTTDRLLALCFRQVVLREEHYAALAQRPRDELSGAIARRLGDRPSENVQTVCRDILRNVLQGDGAELFRTHFADLPMRAPIRWAATAAKCLPRKEMLELTWDMIARSDGLALKDAANALEHCRTPAAFGWIERTIGQPKLVAPFWGELAAKSGLSWPRARRWLACGRPLSLVALDALQAIARLRDTKSEFNDVRLAEVADRVDVVDALRAYAAKDDVPRVSRAVTTIVEKINAICQ
jgi:hypothetical protein